jgi:ubiquinone/menaquinone biosynthesis C-methylase UbiE
MPALRSLLTPFYDLLDRAEVYALLQKVGRPTTRRFRALLRKHVVGALRPGASIVDLACGEGAYRELFPATYSGVDINPDYIAAALRRYGGSFQVMDCTHLQFADASFDHAVTIAGTHHFDDESLLAMLAEAQRVVKQGGSVHIIDAVLPLNKLHLWKELWFRMDRGLYPRRAERLNALIARAGKIDAMELVRGPLHDVIYVRLVK